MKLDAFEEALRHTPAPPPRRNWTAFIFWMFLGLLLILGTLLLAVMVRTVLYWVS